MTFRAPLFIQEQRKAEAQQPHVAPNLLLTLLAVTATAPFVQCEWATSQSVDSYEHEFYPAAALRLPAQADQPFGLREWPVPQAIEDLDHPVYILGAMRPLPATLGVIMRAPTFAPQSLVADLDFDPLIRNAILSGLADIPDPPIQSLSSEPVEWEDRYHVGTQSSPQQLLTVPISTPVGVIVDWPQIETADEGEAHVLFTVRYEPEQTPFVLTDWPVPWVVEHDQESPAVLNLLGTLLAPLPPPPFVQHDWPLPILLDAPDFYVDGQSLEHTTLFVPNVKPFVENEWPLAVQAEERFQESTSASFQALLDAPNPMPFAQSEWPVPERVWVSFEEHGYTFSASITSGVPQIGQPAINRTTIMKAPNKISTVRVSKRTTKA